MAEVLGPKSVPVSPCPLQTTDCLTWKRIRASAVADNYRSVQFSIYCFDRQDSSPLILSFARVFKTEPFQPEDVSILGR